VRVRHAQFGFGNVIAVEEHNDDMKVTVRFNSVGVKKLLGKYAKLGTGVIGTPARASGA
jgi:PcrA/UvrD tudor domain